MLRRTKAIPDLGSVPYWPGATTQTWFSAARAGRAPNGHSKKAEAALMRDDALSRLFF